MTTAGANPRRRRIWKYLLSALLVWLLILGSLVWYATTDSFQAMVRHRLITELEKITGGRVELGSFHTTPFRLRVEVRNLTIHGTEGADQIPYFHAASVVAEVKVVSALGFEFGFHSLILEHPVVHVIVYPDGSTNQPAPRASQTSRQSPVERLFNLSIGRLEARHGELLWNDQPIPMDFAASDVSAAMTYSVLHRRYFGNLLLGKVVTNIQDYRPVSWMAEVHFTFGANSLNLQSLKVSTGRSHIEANGVIRNFRHPEVQGNYSATLDLMEAAAIARRSEPRGGMAEAKGSLTWLQGDLFSQGKFVLRDFAWRDRTLDLRNVDANSDFSISQKQLSLSQLDAHLLGGRLGGNANVADWLPSPLKAEAKKSAEQRGTAAFRIKDISAGELANAISTSALPLRKMNLAGTADGAIELQWKGSPENTEAKLTLDVSRPSSISPKQLPLNARFRGTYRAATGDLEVVDLNANTRASQIHAAGMLGNTGALRLSAASTDLGEWQPVLEGLGSPVRIPALLHGEASFRGTATGRIPHVTFTGIIQASDFDYLIPANVQLPEKTVHWDSLEADIQVSSKALTIRNGTLKRGDTTVNFGGSGTLARWQFNDQNPVSARLAVHNAELGDVLSLAGYQSTAQGTLNLFLQTSGTLAQPRASGRIQLGNLKIRNQSVQRLESQFRLEGRQLLLDHLQLSYNEARVTGSIDYDFFTQAFHFNLAGTDFDLGRSLDGKTGRTQLAGKLDFEAQGSGTPQQPMMNAIVHLRDLSVDRQRQGNFTLQASTKGPDLHLTGQSQFAAGELTLAGDVHLRGLWPSSLDLRFSHFNLDIPLHPYLRGKLTGPSTASGELHVQGPLLQPRDITLRGSLNELATGVENMQVHNQGPIEFAISNGTLELKSLHLLAEGTDLTADGTVRLAGDHALNFRARGQSNLKLLESFDSAFTSSGTVAMDVDVSGSLSRPILQGRLQITNGAIAYLDLPAAFTDINGSLVFNQDRLLIEKLTAHTGGGEVIFGGNAAWVNHQPSFDVSLQEKDVRLRYPPGISSTANANLRWIGNLTASTVSGDITVTKLSVMPGFDFGAYLQRSSRSAVLPVTNPTLNRIRLDVHIVTTPELQMQTAVVRLSGNADLRLKGNAAKPVILGRAEVLEGEVSFNGTKYELERGEVSFTNPVITTPLLDLQAATHVRDYDITLSLNGPPDKLKVTYRSEPPLPEPDIITLLALGRTTTESAQLQESGQASFTQEASSAIINQALNATVTNRAQRLFGVSRIKIDPEGLNSETTLARGPAVTIEEQVANNLTITYSTSVQQASQQIIQVVYNLPHNISIVAVRDQNGVVSFDVKIRRRKK